MPFVHRSEDGGVLAVYEEFIEGTEEIAADDPALKAFILKNIPSVGGPLDDEWVSSDLAMVRVLEDLISVLIEKKVVLFSDFPEGAQHKLQDRSRIRKEVTYVEDLFGSGDDELGGNTDLF